jgi:hemerythrin-like domain-containing protein
MKPTEILMQEHEAIKQILRILNKICDEMEFGEQIDHAHLEQVLDFIKNFADKCHHGKEEKILFEAMEKVGFAKQSGPLGIMIYEHNMGRDIVKKLANAIELYGTGNKDVKSNIIEYARKYITLLDQHINKENIILFPMADSHLSESQQNKISEEFELFEQREMGAGKHEEFHTMLKNLNEVYLHSKQVVM